MEWNGIIIQKRGYEDKSYWVFKEWYDGREDISEWELMDKFETRKEAVEYAKSKHHNLMKEGF